MRVCVCVYVCACAHTVIQTTIGIYLQYGQFLCLLNGPRNLYRLPIVGIY